MTEEQYTFDVKRWMMASLNAKLGPKTEAVGIFVLLAVKLLQLLIQSTYVGVT